MFERVKAFIKKYWIAVTAVALALVVLVKTQAVDT